MTSRFRVLEKAKIILVRKQFCLFDDPRFDSKGIARRGDGVSTGAENKTAVMFTLTGAVARAIFDLTGRSWITEHTVYAAAMQPLYGKVALDHYSFVRLCDVLGKDKCIGLLDEALEI